MSNFPKSIPQLQCYQYTALPVSTHTAIRLLRVQEPLLDNLISCVLRIATTEAKYVCLSYTWGPEDNQQNILINGNILRVRRNLWEFLQMARLNYADIELWIDAVCINQNDDVERAQQVQMMMDMYVSGQRTLIWLGNPSTSSSGLQKQAMSFDSVLVDVSPWLEAFIDMLVDLEIPRSEYAEEAKVIVRQDGLWAMDIEGTRHETLLLQLVEALSRDDVLSSVWFLVTSLCYHVYWTRMWIVQEIYSSQNIELIYGNVKMGAREFFHILSFVRQLGETIEYSDSVKPEREYDCPQIRPKDSYYEKVLGIPLRATAGHQADTSLNSKYTISKVVASEAVVIHPILVDLWVHRTESDSDDCIAHRLGGEWLYARPTEQLDLAVLLDAYQTSQCSSRNDKVFALAGLCSSTLPIKVDYSLSLCDLYFRVCESLCVVEEQRTFLIGSLMRNLHISLLDFLMSGRRTAAKRLVHESNAKVAVELERTEMIYFVRNRLGASQADEITEKYFMRGYCESCSCSIDFEYMAPSPDEKLELDAVFVQCFGSGHTGISLDFHPELGYKVLFIEQVDHSDTQYNLDLPDHQLWKTERSVNGIPLSSVLKEAVILHKLLLDEVTWKEDDMVAPVPVNSGDSIVDQLIIQFSRCEAFAASRKISRETLNKLFEPDLATQVAQYLNG